MDLAHLRASVLVACTPTTTPAVLLFPWLVVFQRCAFFAGFSQKRFGFLPIPQKTQPIKERNSAGFLLNSALAPRTN
jgi:hypothetical protein